MKKMVAIGLMSGTSMDGIDLALVETDGHDHVCTRKERFFPYSPALRNTLSAALVSAKKITSRHERPDNLADVEALITSLHGEAVKEFLNESDLSADGIDVIGFHGQTVLHRPQQGITVQLGDGGLLAKMTGIDVVFDMRANDMRHGGQGAPLVPVYHQALAKNLDPQLRTSLPDNAAIAFVNIGGISNITFVSANEIIAFDSGPGNALIDQWVQAHAGIPYDQNGMIASEGRIIDSLLELYLAESFFDKPAPKSLDRNDFIPPQGDKASLEDGARTLARLTAAAIFKSLDHLPRPPILWIIGGGGRHNRVIMDDLRDLAAINNSRVVSAEEAGFSGDSMEAEAWAYLAVRSLKGLPLSFPTTTGCREAVSGGVLARKPAT